MALRSYLLAGVTTLALWIILLWASGFPLNWVTILLPWFGAIIAFIFAAVFNFFVGFYQAMMTDKPNRPKGPWG